MARNSDSSKEFLEFSVTEMSPGWAKRWSRIRGLKYYLCRNEQAMVHTAVAFAKANFRMRTLACTTSIGPGATNMVTGAALATVNRLPVLLLPGDIFARRNVAPVLQQLESAQFARYFGE